MGGYIYIMTNPCLKDMVKIGYATDVEARRKQLSTTALPFEYEVYATYETTGNFEDKKLHELIDRLNPDLRLAKNREFFAMSGEDAYRMLETIAEISGSTDKLKRLKEKSEQICSKRNGIHREYSQRHQKDRIRFSACQIPVGAELEFSEDRDIKVNVFDDIHIIYKEEVLSMSGLAQRLTGKGPLQGSRYFLYNGKTITEIAKETQWKGDNCENQD